jgi:hypothetical protein
MQATVVYLFFLFPIFSKKKYISRSVAQQHLYIYTAGISNKPRDNLRLVAAAANVTEARGNSGRHKFPTWNMSIIHSTVRTGSLLRLPFP